MVQSEEERKAKRCEYRKKYNQRPEVKARQHEYRKKYHQKPEVREKLKNRQRERYHNDPEYRQKMLNYQRQFDLKKKLQQPHICPTCHLYFQILKLHKCHHNHNPMRFAEIQKLKTQSHITPQEVCKKVSCLVTRELAFKNLQSHFELLEIEEIVEFIKQIERGIFEKTGMSPQMKPQNILGVAFFLWNQWQQKPIDLEEILRLSEIKQFTLWTMLQKLWDWKIVVPEDKFNMKAYSRYNFDHVQWLLNI